MDLGAWIQDRLGSSHNGDESVCLRVCMHVQSPCLRTQALGQTTQAPHPDFATSLAIAKVTKSHHHPTCQAEAQRLEKCLLPG